MSDEKKADVKAVTVGVRGIMTLHVDGNGEVVMAQVDSVDVGHFDGESRPDAQMQEWTEKYAPLVVAWFGRLLLTGAREAAKEYAVAQSHSKDSKDSKEELKS